MARPKQGSSSAHGSPLGADEVTLTKENLGWEGEEPFYVPEEAQAHFRKALERGGAESDWRERFAVYRSEHPELAAEWGAVFTIRRWNLTAADKSSGADHADANVFIMDGVGHELVNSHSGGANRFSSSDQFSTTWISLSSVASVSTMMNRVPSSDTS